MTYRKKLIEVALPLDAINRAAAEEKSVPRRGHPSTLHLWWSRKPLGVCRAVLFASLVDDPSSRPHEFPTEEDQQEERERLFNLIEELVKWENVNNGRILGQARDEILKSTDGSPPPVLDPFCGGGSIPLEAQRLGLEACASDLNPVAVFITKAMIQMPPRFAGQSPVNPDSQIGLMRNHQSWTGAAGLAEDVRFYGEWIRDEAQKCIGSFYPKALLPREYGNRESTVLAWLWARTVCCPNPACGIQMPLVHSFVVAAKRQIRVWALPVLDRLEKKVRFRIEEGSGAPPKGTVNRHGARCIGCSESVSFDYIRAEGRAGRIDEQLMALVIEGDQERVYLEPSDEHADVAIEARPNWTLDTSLPDRAIGFSVQSYGMTKHCHLFTQRQLLAMTTFCDLVGKVQEKIKEDAIAAGLPSDNIPLHAGGGSAHAYSEAITVYLGCALSRLASYNNSLCRWNERGGSIASIFTRQAIGMLWNFIESNPLEKMSGNWKGALEWVTDVLKALPLGPEEWIHRKHCLLATICLSLQPIPLIMTILVMLTSRISSMFGFVEV